MKNNSGFTLIELSIVLVIIGLIIGGILLGRDLISAAAVNAQIAQITKYNSAVNTFHDKYGGLPGDLNSTLASQFGFQPRGLYTAEGDGNGIIEGLHGDGASQNCSVCQTAGEVVMFWRDLSDAKYIDASFSVASETAINFADTGTGMQNLYLPPARIGNGNYINIWSGGANASSAPQLLTDGYNYFELSAVNGMGNIAGWALNTGPGLTVVQAYNIDKKVDDGLPQAGSVRAWYINYGVENYTVSWAAGGGLEGAQTSHGPSTAATAQTSNTCYDNGGAGGTMQYSLGSTANGGAGLNCALSFKFE